MKKEPLSECCDSKINIRENGVSQLSFDPHFFCSKCGKELDVDYRLFNW